MKPARDEILDRLKKAVHPVPDEPDMTTPVFPELKGQLDQVFKENLEKVNGNVYLLNSEKDLYHEVRKFLSQFNSKNIACLEPNLVSKMQEYDFDFEVSDKIPESIEVGITKCEYLIAHTGSVMVSSAFKGGRRLFVYPPVHVVIANKDQLVDFLDRAYSEIRKKYKNKLPSQITLITGPSRTADIEKTLILGAHGPRQLHVFIES